MSLNHYYDKELNREIYFSEHLWYKKTDAKHKHGAYDGQYNDKHHERHTDKHKDNPANRHNRENIANREQLYNIHDIYNIDDKGAACVIARQVIKLKDSTKIKNYLEYVIKKYKLKSDDREYLENLF